MYAALAIGDIAAEDILHACHPLLSPLFDRQSPISSVPIEFDRTLCLRTPPATGAVHPADGTRRGGCSRRARARGARGGAGHGGDNQTVRAALPARRGLASIWRVSHTRSASGRVAASRGAERADRAHERHERRPRRPCRLLPPRLWCAHLCTTRSTSVALRFVQSVAFVECAAYQSRQRDRRAWCRPAEWAGGRRAAGAGAGACAGDGAGSSARSGAHGQGGAGQQPAEAHDGCSANGGRAALPCAR